MNKLYPDNDSVVILDNVSIIYNRNMSLRRDTNGKIIKTLFSKKIQFHALNNISMDIKRGETIGIIGENGAGKTTLLKVISQVLYPDKGSIKINGKVSSLMSLGAGFLPTLSGRENIYINGVFLGLSRKDIDRRIDDIIRFSGIEDFIDTPIRYYSSGMKARLGFSIAVHTDPEILVLDEVIAAGDKEFKQMAQTKMKQFMQKAKAIVIASHSMKMITDLCDRCFWLEKGDLKMEGQASEIVKTYNSL